MMAGIGGCELTHRLYDGRDSTLYRGRRTADGLPVVLKVLKDPHPSPARLAALQHEYAVLRALEGANGIQAHALFEDQGRWALVMEDFGGTSLKELGLAGKLAVEDVLELALAMTDRLDAVHRRRVLHKDLNPSNVLYNPAGGRLALIDFGIATTLPQETTAFVSPSVLEGTLAYMSPEQTGRMNRPLDYRTDYYSLGVTLYELLTGRPPFITSDALELVHWHIARQPPSPRELAGEVPQVVADIVLKLLAKNADDRYQSLRGLRADLRECLERLRRGGELEPFPLARHDGTEHFRLPQKLYGREAEVRQLLAAFERVQAGAVLMLVSGYSGVGKSALVQEVYRPLTHQHGAFISGKFDVSSTGVPYPALGQALHELVQLVLTESEDRLAAVRHRILSAVQPNAQVLLELCPTLERVIGPQPEVQPLPPADARNRLQQAVLGLLSAVATPEHPLCIFLDDLQWADADSLRLLSELLGSAAELPLFIIGAYRENEVGEVHPLRLTVRELEARGSRVERLVLGPLGGAEVRALVADTLAISKEDAAPLAELLLSRTGGNPFFVRAFLTSLHADGLLAATPSGWRWDLDRIRQRGATDNVVDLMMDRVRRLPEATQQVLQLAACLGGRFELSTLGLVAGRGDGSVGNDLWPAIVEGLVIALDAVHSPVELVAIAASAECRFTHDRIQQAVLTMMDEARRARLHRDVGRRLRDHGGPEGQERWLFDIVGQLNQGRVAIDAPEELDALADLNLQAARRAMRSAAAQRALDYARAGIALLREEDWTRRYALALELHVTGAQAAFERAELETLEALSRAALQHTREPMDEVPLRLLEAQVHYSQQRYAAGLHTCVQALRRLGFDMPETATPEEIAHELKVTRELLGERPVESLLELPVCTDANARAALRLLNPMALLTLTQQHPLFAVVCARMVQLSLRYGNAPESSGGYTFFGSILAMGDELDLGYRFGRLAVDVAERFGDKVLLSQAYTYANAQLLHWKQPLYDVLPHFTAAYRYALEVASPFNIASGATTLCIDRLLSGANLRELAADMKGYRDVIKRLRQVLVLNWHEINEQVVLNLAEDRPRPTVLAGPLFDEGPRLAEHAAANLPGMLFHYNFLKMMLCCVFGDFPTAAGHAEQLDTLGQIFHKSIYAAPMTFLSALSRLGACDTAAPADRERLLQQAAVQRDSLRKWRELCPKSIEHKLLLVEAEEARVRGDEARAREAFEQGIERARQSGYAHEEALAYELAARFYLRAGDGTAGRRYMRYAHQAYSRWGAISKVRAMEREHVYLLPNLSAMPGAAQIVAASDRRDFHILDLISIVHASQAISREIKLDRLLTRLMQLLIETGGAEAGHLLLERHGQWVVEVEKLADQPEARVLPSVPMAALEAQGHRGLPNSIIHYVTRTGESVVLDDAAASPQFGRDPYILRNRVRSVLCFPLSRQAGRLGVVYLENNLAHGAFTRDRIEVLQLLSAQAVISLENAVLYETLEQKVEERTHELKTKHDELAATLDRLREAQNRLIVQDRLAALGTMTAGIAHELRNPLNFVNSFSELSGELIQELVGGLEALGSRLGTEQIAHMHGALSDLELNMSKIHEHGQRMETIIRAMLEHSRGGKGERQDVELNTLVSNYVQLAYQGMRSRDPSFNTAIAVELDPTIRTVNLVPQEISRVIVNLLDNACYAVNAKRQKQPANAFQARIQVKTRKLDTGVEIRVHDNGIGIQQGARNKVFTPFFTTKRTGEGTGLGLSLSHDIVVKGHGGTLHFESEEGAYTEFIITLPARS